MKQIHKFIVVILLILVNIVTFIYDKSIIEFVAAHRMPFLDNFLFILAFDYFILFLLIVFTAIFINSALVNKKKCWVIPMWISVSIAYFVSHVINYFIKRQRPFVTYKIPVLVSLFQTLSRNINYLYSSFPCCHTMVIFSILPIINKNYPKLEKFWLIFAIVIGFSRLYFGVNYLSDLIAGAIIGYLIGSSVVFIEDRFHYGMEIKEYIQKKILRRS